MISILIPSYQNDCHLLVKTLHEQAVLCGIPFEIIVGEDGPEPVFHPDTTLSFVRIENNRENMGRASNRNRLAAMAKYPYLLFIDADAEVYNPQFLTNYLTFIPDEDVVCGGTAYFYDPPADAGKRLRWRYGIHREQIPFTERNEHPFDAFSAFNFLIRSELFDAIRFPEALSRYGHEDTWLGQALKKAGVRLLHIENPAIHTGIDDAETFLKKTREGVENLAELTGTDAHFDSKGIRLLRYFRFLKRFGMQRLMVRLYHHFHLRWERHLIRQGGPLWLFDVYKLTYLFFLKQG